MEIIRQWIDYSTHHPSPCVQCVLDDYRGKVKLKNVVPKKCNHGNGLYEALKKADEAHGGGHYPIPIIPD